MFESEYEAVCFCHDRKTGLKAIIAIHSTRLGPALGGTRIFDYENEQQALKDVLALSRSMTFKAAAAELPFGGGKAVILMAPNDPNRQSKLAAFCKFVNLFCGNFQTGEDLGITYNDLAMMREISPYVHYSPPDLPQHLHISSLTARGVLVGIRACLRQVFGNADLSRRHIAIQGIGKVGWHLMELLRKEGARVTVADLQQDLAEKAIAEWGCEKEDPENILTLAADIISPCAGGDVITPSVAESMQATIVAGCANNQLSSSDVADILHRRGILYAPDFVINAGGLISAMLEMDLEDEKSMLARVDGIENRLLGLFDLARTRNCSPLQVVVEEVNQKLG